MSHFPGLTDLWEIPDRTDYDERARSAEGEVLLEVIAGRMTIRMTMVSAAHVLDFSIRKVRQPSLWLLEHICCAAIYKCAITPVYRQLFHVLCPAINRLILSRDFQVSHDERDLCLRCARPKTHESPPRREGFRIEFLCKIWLRGQDFILTCDRRNRLTPF
ncbi:hypothetical protein ASD85_26625 [Rhizobium sp. Root651]|nr:hypothetical protein ASD85_26625 [Rhizobium sp. Root651]